LHPLLRRTVQSRLLALVALAALYALGVGLFDRVVLNDMLNVPFGLQTLVGTLLGLLLVLRTNTAYDRWWEGRRLWGQLLGEGRNLCIKLRRLGRLERPAARQLSRLVVSFTHALRDHLRDGVQAAQLTIFRRRDRPEDVDHVPQQLVCLIWDEIGRWRAEGTIDGWDELLLAPHVNALLEICGACERIRRTPLVPSYRKFVHQGVALYLLLLPWGLECDFGWWAVPAVAVIAYFMIGLELIANDVAEPFGRGADDILLEELVQSFEQSVREILGSEASTEETRS